MTAAERCADSATTSLKESRTSSMDHLFMVFCLFLLVVSMQNSLGFQKLRWAAGVAEQTHMFVVSSFYYNHSKSLPSNTIAIIYSSRKHVIDFPIVCVSKDYLGHERRAPAVTDMALVAPVQCKWTTMVALCPVVRNPVKFAIEGDAGQTHTIAFRPADSTPRNFVVCMSRMFLFENWQLLIASLEIYRHYGADLMVTYVESVITGIHRILKAYENEGFVSIKSAVRLFQPPDLDYDPNTENEWYNQDFSYNSCLYEYKESAEFMLIADWDDILIPEFGRDYTAQMRWLHDLHPGTSAFIFTRPQSLIHTSHSPQHFDLSRMIDSVEVDSTNLNTGKFVARPELVDGIWLHAPSRVRSDHRVVELDDSSARVLHFREWKFDEPKNTETPNRTYVADGQQIEDEFAAFLLRNNLTQTFMNLPKEFIYYHKLVECYRNFASLLQKHSFGCPSLPKCRLEPVHNSSCTVLSFKYESTPLLNGFHVHQPYDNQFIDHQSGCRT